MLFKIRRSLGAALILSVFIQMHVLESGYASGRPKIVFSSTRDGNHEIYVMDSDGGNQRRVTNHPDFDLDPSWSPDGKKIAFVSHRDGGTPHIYIMDSDGGNPIKLIKGGLDPAWSPGGAKIAMTYGTGNDIDIYVMDTDGGNLTQLTHLGWNYHPTWSPDGKRIAYVTSRRHGGPEIYAMDQDGNNEVRLTRDLLLKKRPSWSPDGQRIAYDAMHRGAVFQIYVVEADGSGRTKRLTRNVPAKWSPAWSLDGNTIAYSAAVPFNQSTIHLMTTDGDYLKQLSVFEDGVESNPDWFDPVGRRVSPAANYLTIWGKIKKPAAARR